MVYARTVAGQELTFGVSGKLIMNALVMYDHQTETLWSQFLSLGVDGPLAGTRLELLPALQTDWATWRNLHPDTLVLTTRWPLAGDPYMGYYGSGSTGILGESNRDDRVMSKELVLAVEVEGRSKAYPFRAMLETPLANFSPEDLPLLVVNDSLGDSSLLVLLDGRSGTSLVYDRTLAGRTLTFQTAEEGQGELTLVDQETGTRWMALTGVAMEGPLKGHTLRRIPTHYSFWFAWSDFYPDTEVYTP